MALATADADGQPSVRMVLLKGHGPDGFVFYTNEQSAKGEQLAANPQAALAVSLEVAAPPGADRRARSSACRTPKRTPISRTRARDSQLGAWASDQSRPLDSRATFEQRFEEMKRRFEGQDVPRPPHWGGYRRDPASGSNSGPTARTGCTSGACSRATDGGWSEGLLYP